MAQKNIKTDYRKNKFHYFLRSNQSNRCPLSNINWSAAIPTQSDNSPVQSSFEASVLLLSFMIAIIANSTIIPNGTRRKIPPPASSERKPPTVGPIIGPKTTPIPNIAVAVPCSFVERCHKTIAIAIGTNGAPKPPWRIGNNQLFEVL